MSIFDLNLERKNKLEIAIERIKFFQPKEGYYLGFSGGKDSIVCKQLCILAGVKFDSHYNLTTIDPPELVNYIKKFHPDTIIDKPKKSMWQLIIEKGMPPTRLMRYCCDELKEHGGEGRYVITGVRWAESARRKNTRKTNEIFIKSKSKKVEELKKIYLNSDNEEKRRLNETCLSKYKRVLNPIIDWDDSDVWEFIKYFKLPYCELYDKGYKRLGCIGCPNSTKARAELEAYPKYKEQYIRTFEKMLKLRQEKGKVTEWKTGQEVLDWWLPLKI